MSTPRSLSRMCIWNPARKGLYVYTIMFCDIKHLRNSLRCAVEINSSKRARRHSSQFACSPRACHRNHRVPGIICYCRHDYELYNRTAVLAAALSLSQPHIIPCSLANQSALSWYNRLLRSPVTKGRLRCCRYVVAITTTHPVFIG